ncbi:MAG TPA: chorismate synthase, partial [Planctomycetota bacterium]|nr:chorismate synthase [Planctomycetota bacterium]
EQVPVPTNPRPGHADLAGCQKLWSRDPRAVMERASARETAARTALGAVARQVLAPFGVDVFAHVVELGGERVDGAALERARTLPTAELRALRAASDFHTLDPEGDARLRAVVDAAREAGDSLGGVFEVVATGLPPGLGSYHAAPERLTARLGAALFSIPAIKGVEFGLGFEAARRPGSQVQDAIRVGDGPWGRFARPTNRAGGLEGGLTTGEPVVARAAMKPIPTLRAGVPTVDFESGEERPATYQRSDVTSVPSASVVGEAVVALELAAAFLERFGGDSLEQVRGAWEAHREALRRL